MEIFSHTSTAPSAWQRGSDLGQKFKPQITHNVRRYLEFFKRMGIPADIPAIVAESSYEQIELHFPEFLDECEGIADGAGLPLVDLLAVTARTEVLSRGNVFGVGECTTAVYRGQKSRPPRTVQTWDWKPALVTAALVLTYQTSRNRVTTFREFGMGAKFGINSHGLAAHMNLLSHQTDGERAGLPIHAVQQMLLERCATVDEVARLLQSVPVAGSGALTISHFDGGQSNIACFEVSPESVIEINGCGEFLFHTNHFLDAELQSGERMFGELAKDSADRLRAASTRPSELLKSPDFAERAMGLCGASGALSPVVMRPDDSLPEELRVGTLATLSFEFDPPALVIAPQEPSNLHPQEVSKHVVGTHDEHIQSRLLA